MILIYSDWFDSSNTQFPVVTFGSESGLLWTKRDQVQIETDLASSFDVASTATLTSSPSSELLESSSTQRQNGFLLCFWACSASKMLEMYSSTLKLVSPGPIKIQIASRISSANCQVVLSSAHQPRTRGLINSSRIEKSLELHMALPAYQKNNACNCLNGA